jgi:hypothetical protein
VEGKVTQRKKKNDEADKNWVNETYNKTPTPKNGGRGKNSHQPRPNTTSTKKTWADVIKSGGINVQIVLGNGNLGLTTPMTMRVERRGGVAQRLGRKIDAGERGVIGRGKDGLAMTLRRGNQGGKMEKDGRGRVEDREEPSMVASVQAGHMDKMT